MISGGDDGGGDDVVRRDDVENPQPGPVWRLIGCPGRCEDWASDEG